MNDTPLDAVARPGSQVGHHDFRLTKPSAAPKKTNTDPPADVIPSEETAQAFLLGLLHFLEKNRRKPNHSLRATLVRRVKKVLAGRTPKIIAVLQHKLEIATRELEYYTEREAYFADILRVADRGQYRADWDAAIRAVVEERDDLRRRLDVVRDVIHRQGDVLEHDDPSCPGDDTCGCQDHRLLNDALRDALLE